MGNKDHDGKLARLQPSSYPSPVDFGPHFLGTILAIIGESSAELFLLCRPDANETKMLASYVG